VTTIVVSSERPSTRTLVSLIPARLVAPFVIYRLTSSIWSEPRRNKLLTSDAAIHAAR
jgi:hypothetical protein